MDLLRKNGLVLLAFIVPVLLIGAVLATTAISAQGAKTEYNFVYALCDDGLNYYQRACDDYLKTRYDVVDGKLQILPISPTQDSDNDGTFDVNENYSVRIFLHDTNENVSREIAEGDAQRLSLEDLLTSPDDVTFSFGYNRGPDSFFLFGGSSSSGYYLTKGSSKQKLNLIHDDDRYYYRDRVHFLGWVTDSK